jgi:hypothetical protein
MWRRAMPLRVNLLRLRHFLAGHRLGLVEGVRRTVTRPKWMGDEREPAWRGQRVFIKMWMLNTFS